MRIKIYNFFVNKHPGIQSRYHSMHDNSTGLKKVLSWIYLMWLNFAYYFLFCRFLGKKPQMAAYEEKNLFTDGPESAHAPKVETYLEELSRYDIISFDIFDTLIFRPFSEPTDVFYFLGERLGFLDFKRIRMEAEQEARWEKFRRKKSFEVTLKEIWTKLEEKTGLSAEAGMQLEEELELLFCYANPMMQQVYKRLLEMGKQILILSDMYMSEAFLKKMLEKNGYQGFQKLYVSCEYNKSKGSGELFAMVKKQLGIKDWEMIHVGDNEYSDGKKAKQQKIKPCHYPNVNKNTLMCRPYDMSPVIGGAYRGLVNNTLYCGAEQYSMEYEYGYIYGGLFVLGYCQFIHEYGKAHGVDKILFLSRDGDIVRQVYQKLYPEEQTEYVYWSRKAAAKLMAASDRYDYFRRFLYHKVNQKITIREIFQSMELEDLLNKLPKSLRPNQELTGTNVKEVKEFLMKHWKTVLRTYGPEHRAASVYYGRILRGCQKAAAVDIGWAGSGAMSLSHLVSSVWGIPCEIVGIVAGTNTIHNAEPDASEVFLQSGRLTAYLYSQAHNRDLLKKHNPNKDYNVFWELLLSSPTRQFTGFGLLADGSVELKFGAYDENLEGIREIQKGILDFVTDYQEHFGTFPYMERISGRDAYAPMVVAASNQERYLKAIEKRFALDIQVR